MSAVLPQARPHSDADASCAHRVLDHIVAEHAQEAATLRHQRTRLVRAPQGGLPALWRLDERIEAHLDGLAVAGGAGLAACRAGLDGAAAGDALGPSFALGVLALRMHNEPVLELLFELAGPRSDVRQGLASAFGWVSADTLQGVVRRTLASPLPQARAVALAACRMHRVDPGPALAVALTDSDATLRVAALRAAGHLGRLDLLPQVCSALGAADPDAAYWAAWSACRLGERQASMPVLLAASQQPGAAGEAALALLMATASDEQAQDLARTLSAVAQSHPTSAAKRRRVRAIALLGDTRFVPWLLDRMDEPALARLAAQALCWITGADLSTLELERLDAPVSATAAATAADDANDPDVALDDDEGLPWPDAAGVRAWWGRAPLGQAPHAPRLFMGQALAGGATQTVLLQGQQDQRAYAALLLATQQPGSMLFAVAAPSWRQQRWLLAA